MLRYIKISYQTHSTNQALMKCIMYIGKYYGKNKLDELEEGIAYLAKKVKGASKCSIKFMIYSKKIDKSQMREWRFKKKSYDRVYRYIINRLLNNKNGNREEALELLHGLYIEYVNNYGIRKQFSELLVREQKELLSWAIDKTQYQKYKDDIKKIIQAYDECDKKYNQYL